MGMEPQNYSDEYFQEQERQMKESEELAKKLQLEEEQMAKREKKQDDAECEICYVGLYEDPFTLLENCGHTFHTSCINESFKMNVSLD